MQQRGPGELPRARQTTVDPWWGSKRFFPHLISEFGRTLAACFALALVVSTGACRLSAEKIEFQKALDANQAKDVKTALLHYDNVVKRYVKSELALRAANEAGRLSFYELKNYASAVEYFRHIVLYSPDPAARLEAQKLIADLHYNHLQNYSQAVVEYNRLLELSPSPSDALGYRLALAKSYLYLNNYFQALVEVDAILSRKYDPKLLFDVYELKANILLQSKRHDEAAEVLRDVLERYPEQARQRQTGLVLAVCYEEKRDFAKAIETLNSIKDIYPNQEFIEARIKSLKERQSYLPGAQGLRK